MVNTLGSILITNSILQRDLYSVYMSITVYYLLFGELLMLLASVHTAVLALHHSSVAVCQRRKEGAAVLYTHSQRCGVRVQ
jgi:hypothetical protein